MQEIENVIEDRAIIQQRLNHYVAATESRINTVDRNVEQLAPPPGPQYFNIYRLLQLIGFPWFARGENNNEVPAGAGMGTKDDEDVDMCLICRDDVVDGANSTECWVCHKIFHRVCMDQYQTSRMEEEHATECPHCRAVWSFPDV